MRCIFEGCAGFSKHTCLYLGGGDRQPCSRHVTQVVVRIIAQGLVHETWLKCDKAYPGLGNRSIFYPGSSKGSTITFGIVEDPSSNPTSKISIKENACACVLYYKPVSLGPQDLDVA